MKNLHSIPNEAKNPFATLTPEQSRGLAYLLFTHQNRNYIYDAQIANGQLVGIRFRHNYRYQRWTDANLYTLEIWSRYWREEMGEPDFSLIELPKRKKRRCSN